MKKTDLSEYSDSELLMWVLNDEALYRLRKNKSALFELIDEIFIYTNEQKNELAVALENGEV